MMPPTRPLLRYFGGKWRIAPWIIAHFPAHDIYVEPCGGAAAVLLQKEPCRSEVYNDLDGELVNLFTVLRSSAADELIRQIRLTPYARREYVDAHEGCDDPMERARRLLIRSHMGHGTRGTRLDRMSGFRSDGVTGSTRVAGEWGDLPPHLALIVERLRRVSIENKPATELLRYWSDPKVLVYLDPPYLWETRSTKSKQSEGYHTYAHEMTRADHVALLDAVRQSRSMVILSGYESDLYDEALRGWTKRTRTARSHRNSPRMEVIWINPLASARLGHGALFEIAA